VQRADNFLKAKPIEIDELKMIINLMLIARYSEQNADLIFISKFSIVQSLEKAQ